MQPHFSTYCYRRCYSRSQPPHIGERKTFLLEFDFDYNNRGNVPSTNTICVEFLCFKMGFRPNTSIIEAKFSKNSLRKISLLKFFYWWPSHHQYHRLFSRGKRKYIFSDYFCGYTAYSSKYSLLHVSRKNKQNTKALVYWL